MNAVGAGKSPRNALATIVKKDHEQPEHFYVYYRLDDFPDLTPAERDAVLKGEQIRYAKEGPRRMEVGDEKYANLSDGKQLTVKYAYYPAVLWGVSETIRVPW